MLDDTAGPAQDALLEVAPYLDSTKWDPRPNRRHGYGVPFMTRDNRAPATEEVLWDSGRIIDPGYGSNLNVAVRIKGASQVAPRVGSKRYPPMIRSA